MQNSIKLWALILASLCLGSFATAALSVASFQDVAAKKQDDKKSDKKSDIVVKAADGKLEFTCSGSWKNQKPKSRMLAVEIKIPKTGDDKADGRLTIMGATGGVQPNIDRWMDQFEGAIVSKTKEIEVSGMKVHLVDIKGTYSGGMGGPFGPKTSHDDYRMLAAIIETKGMGLQFIKLTGPQATLEANKKKFDAFVKSLKVVE